VAKTSFILEADEAKAVQAYLKVVEAQNKATEGQRRMNREGKEMDKSYAGLRNITGELAGMVTGFFTVSSAVRLVIAEFEDMKRKGEEAFKSITAYANDFSRNISGWLGVGRVDEAAAAIAALTKKIPELSMTSGQAILSAYGGTGPKTTLGRGLEITEKLAPMTWADQPEVARLAGELEDIYPGMSTEDLLDMAAEARRKAGSRKGELPERMKEVMRLKQYGVSSDEALGMIMTTLETEQAGRGAGAVAGLLAQPREPFKKKLGVPLTEEQKIQNEVAGMTEQQMYSWMKANPDKAKKLFGPGWVAVAPLFQPGLISGGVEMVQRARAEDAFAQELAAGGESAIIGIQRTGVRRGAAIENLKLGYGPGAEAAMVRQSVEEYLKAMPGVGWMQRKLIMAGIEAEGIITGDYKGAATKALMQLQQPMYIGPYYGGAAPPQQELVEGIKLLLTDIQKAGDSIKQAAAEMKKSSQHLEETTRKNVPSVKPLE